MSAPFSPPLDCLEPVVRAGAQGILRVAVDDEQARLIVTLARAITDGAGALLPGSAYALDPRSYSLTGGQRRFPHVVAADLRTPNEPNARAVVLSLDQLGDFSVYTLTLNGPDVDPFFAGRKLRFRLACDDPFDCREEPPPAPPAPAIPVAIDYLAKDYSSFRQALLDFVPTRLPTWTERSEADVGMMLLELFAATADSLSYMQDRVANEAFLESASQRASVAGHLALIGYQLDNGASATAWLQFQVQPDTGPANRSVTIPVGFRVTTQPRPVDPSVVDPRHAAEPVVVFETFAAATVHSDLNEIALYDWDGDECCLPRGSTSAALVGEHSLPRAGDYLLFDDQHGRREIVRLTEEPTFRAADPITGSPDGPLTIVRWAPPLEGAFCAAETIARGNLVLATHGETFGETLREFESDEIAAINAEIAARPPTTLSPCAWRHRLPRQRLRLGLGPLAHLDPSTSDLLALLNEDESAVTVDDFTARPRGSISTLQVTVDGDVWEERASLLDSRADDPVFRVEIADDGDAAVVFGDDCFGRRPLETSTVLATYRIGGGRIGNVAADTLRTLPPPRGDLVFVTEVTNPLPATGGRDLETADRARRFAPETFKTPLVAVTAADYQNAARVFTDRAGQGQIQRARADFRWTGSWLTVTLAVDPRQSETLDAGLRRALLAYLDGRRLAGYDLEAIRARYLPIELEVELCLRGGFLPGDVVQAVQRALGSGELAGGGRGFFHPDNFSFGEGVYVSRLYAAISAVPGVESAQIIRLARLRAAQPDAETARNLANGVLPVGGDEIVRLDNDRNFPENGVLTVRVKGAA